MILKIILYAAHRDSIFLFFVFLPDLLVRLIYYVDEAHFGCEGWAVIELWEPLNRQLAAVIMNPQNPGPDAEILHGFIEFLLISTKL